jgi:TatA/E family protein of Tat protein translocase
MIGNIGPLEIGIVLIIALVVFGPKRLPDLGQSLGKGIREFKGSVTGETDEANEIAESRPARVEARPVTTHRVEDSVATPSHH